MNQVNLIGRVGQDPEVRHLDSGTAVANVSLATSKKYKNREGELVEDTNWHKLEFWGKLAEVVEKWVGKGMQLAVTGEINYQSYEKDDEKRWVTKIRVLNMEMLGGGKDNNNAPANEPKPSAKVPEPVAAGGEGDELPF